MFIPCFSSPCWGQSVSCAGLQDSLVKYTYRFSYTQNETGAIRGLHNDASELSRLDSLLRRAAGATHNATLRIRITGYASIEGDYRTNEHGARSRAENLQSYLLSHYPALASCPMDIAWVAEDWEGLAKLVKASDLNERAEVLQIIRKIQKPEVREELLKKLNGGRAYRQMQREGMFSGLGRVEVEIVDNSSEPTTSPSGDSSFQKEEKQRDAAPRFTMPQELASVDPQELSSFRKEEYPKGEVVGSKVVDSNVVGSSDPHGNLSAALRCRFALKTNLLLWAGVQPDLKYTAPVANVALEYFISNHVSIELGAMYSYWRYNSNQEFQGISGYRLEPRYRLAIPDRRFGAYLGLYGCFGDYDLRSVENGKLKVESYGAGDNAMQVNIAQPTTAQPTFNSQLSTFNSSPQGWTGDYWDAGLSTGVFIRLVGQLGLEAGVRVGYVSTDVMYYTVDGSKNRFTHKEPYGKVRVTDLNLNLVYRFR